MTKAKAGAAGATVGAMVFLALALVNADRPTGLHPWYEPIRVAIIGGLFGSLVGVLLGGGRFGKIGWSALVSFVVASLVHVCFPAFFKGIRTTDLKAAIVISAIPFGFISGSLLEIYFGKEKPPTN